MSRRALALLCLLVIMVAASHLERRLDEPSLQRRTQRLADAGGPMIVLASMLHLNELGRGFLWIQFFGDSTNILANYHRLLPLLDAITWLDPTDTDAWNLKTRMRLQRAVREGDTRLREKAIRDMESAMLFNPRSWELRHELAWQLFVVVGSAGRALPYANRAAAIPDHHMMVERLQFQLHRGLDQPTEALAAIDRLLARPDLEATGRGLAMRQRRWLLSRFGDRIHTPATPAIGTRETNARATAVASVSVENWRAYMTDEKFQDTRATLESMMNASATAQGGQHKHEDRMLAAFLQLALQSKHAQLRRRVGVTLLLMLLVIAWRRHIGTCRANNDGKHT